MSIDVSRFPLVVSTFRGDTMTDEDVRGYLVVALRLAVRIGNRAHELT